MKCLIIIVAVLGCSLAGPTPQFPFNQYNQGRYQPNYQYNRFNTRYPYNQNQYRPQYYSSTYKPFVFSTAAPVSATSPALNEVSSASPQDAQPSLQPVIASVIPSTSFVDGQQYNYRVSDDQNAEILRFDNDATPEGGFQYSYETSNGIAAQAIGSPRALGGNPPEAPIVIQGSYSWVSPEGKVVSISYVADENGYRAVGDAIPTSPPIPEAIIRSVDYNRQYNSSEPTK